jgi:HPr kinase/phosphorylase
LNAQAGQDGVNLHASCIAVEGRGLLILGPSGSGKSALALQLMAFGADLVADDRTQITLQDGKLLASCPVPIHGLIEARGMGLLRAPTVTLVPLVLAVDLSHSSSERLPPRQKMVVLGQELDLVSAIQGNHFPAAILCYLKGSRQD